MKSLILLALVGFAAAQVQIQIPIQRPQQPQPPQWQPQPPVQRPIQPQPRNDWRDGVVDNRCPVPDDHTGWAVLFPGTSANTFVICWGGKAWPFTCPGTSVFRTEVNACADPGWTPPAPPANRFPNNNWNNNNNNNNWQRRPFNNEEEVAAEEN